MDLQSQGSRFIEGIGGLIAGIVPENLLFESDPCCIDGDIIEVQRLTTERKEVVGQFSAFSPIFDSSIIERVKVNGSYLLSLGNGLNIVFFE